MTRHLVRLSTVWHLVRSRRAGRAPRRAVHLADV